MISSASAPSIDAVTQGTLRTGSGRSLPLERTSVRAAVHGHVASVQVGQRFHNDMADPIEAVYVFPLPDGASVFRMEFRIEDRVVRAAVKEKAEARRDYEQARAAGRAATLLEEDRPTLFTLSVANVAPGATIDVELEYQELLSFDDGCFRLVFPMVAPERYREGPSPGPDEKLPPPRQPTGARPLDVTLVVEVRDGGASARARCLSHPVQITAMDGGGTRVLLAPAASLANRDFVLEWPAVEDDPEQGPSGKVGAGVRPRIFFERAEGEDGAFLLTVVPPSSEVEIEASGGAMKAVRCGNCGGLVTDPGSIREIPGLGAVVPCRYCGALLAPGTERITRASRPRDVAILVDRSASMRGSNPHARAAVRAILSALGSGDAAQLLAFDHERLPFDGDGSRWLPLSPELRGAADRVVEGLGPRGGTELEEALSRAASLPIREGRTRVVVLIGDAAVGNEGLLLRKLPKILGAETRLFVLGIGRGVDRRLVGRLARVGGGASDVVAPWGDPDETLRRFARRVGEAGPVLTDLMLWWKGASDVYPRPIPDLYAGQPIHLLGRFSGVGPSLAVLTGRTAGGKAFRQEIAVDLPAASDRTPGLMRLWARRHVEGLAELVAVRPSEELSREALSLSLRHAIVGPYTSLVAVDSEVAVKKLSLPEGRLVVVSGPDAGRTFRLDRERLVLGRHVKVDMLLADPMVSRNHFEVLADARGFFLRDLSSMNSTTLDGQPAREARLCPGMTIKVGRTVLRFELDPEATFEYLPTLRVEAALASPPPGDGESQSPAPGSPPAPAMARRAPSPVARHAPPPMPGSGPSPVLSGGPPPMPRHMPPPIPSSGPPSISGSSPPAAVQPSLPASMPFAAERLMSLRRTGPVQGRAASIPQSPIEAPGSEPYPEHELLWLRDRIRGELDLVFLVDATESMDPYIDEVKRRLLELVDALRAAPLCRSLRLGLVSYRDHPPQERSYVSHVIGLTRDVEQIRQAASQLEASGGGDGPEAVTDGLYDVVRLGWRPDAARAVVWFGDAPPHGVEPGGDGFPGGCPCGHHWYAQAESCREMGIAVYAIGCLPTLRRFVGAEGVFRSVARASRGMFLPLREAGLLVPLIAGAAESELDKQRLDEHVADLWQAQAEALSATDEAERARWLAAALRARGVQIREMRLESESASEAPLRFRDVEARDVTGSLERLRLAGRVAA